MSNEKDVPAPAWGMARIDDNAARCISYSCPSISRLLRILFLCLVVGVLIPGCRKGSPTTLVDLYGLGQFPLDPQSGTINDVPMRNRQLDGCRVRVSGFMWAPDASENTVNAFQLVYNVTGDGHHGPPLVQARIFCTVAGGESVPYYSELVAVTGVLHVRIDRRDGKIISVYSMDVESVADEVVSDWNHYENCCTLFGEYVIHRGIISRSNDSGEFQLLRFEEGSVQSSSIGTSYIVEKLSKFAVHGRFIVGTTESGYFIFDTAGQSDWADTFDDAEHWHAALSAAGIPSDILLNDPSTLTFQNHIFLHYGVMKNLFGLTDDEWFGVIALTTLAAMFVGGMLVREKRSLFGLAVVLAWGFTVAFVALTDSTCGFLGFVAYPPIYWLIGQLGRVLKKYAWDRWRKQRVSVPVQLDK